MLGKMFLYLAEWEEGKKATLTQTRHTKQRSDNNILTLQQVQKMPNKIRDFIVLTDF